MSETTLTPPPPRGPAPRPAGQISPDDLLGGFSQGHLLRWFLAALVIHAVVIGGFSVGTIRDWVDPEGAKARKEAVAAAARAATTPAEVPAPQAATPPAEARLPKKWHLVKMAVGLLFAHNTPPAPTAVLSRKVLSTKAAVVPELKASAAPPEPSSVLS